jgi:hypothetical protein
MAVDGGESYLTEHDRSASRPADYSRTIRIPSPLVNKQYLVAHLASHVERDPKALAREELSGDLEIQSLFVVHSVKGRECINLDDVDFALRRMPHDKGRRRP